MPQQPTTIKEIARRLKVSVSTVSRALSDHPRIGAATKERVRQLAKELNYEPNAQAIFFKQQKTHVIGVVLPFIREEFFSQAISGIETAALEHHYTILFGQSYDEVEKEKAIVGVMRKQRVDGLIISLSKQTKHYDHLHELANYGVPVVYFDRVPPLVKINKVCCDLYNGTIELVNWLFSQGCRRIALINGPDGIVASRERLKGYIEGISRQKLKVDMQLVVKTDLTKQQTNEAISALLNLKQPPTAIITFNEYVHMDAVQFAQARNVKVNRDILFASYANLPITAYTAHPPVASLEQYPFRQGEKAMEMMMQLLSGTQAGSAEKQYFEYEITPTLVIQQAK